MALWPTPEMEHEAQLAKLGVRLKLERAVLEAAMAWSRKKSVHLKRSILAPAEERLLKACAKLKAAMKEGT